MASTFLTSINSLSFISMKNQECKTRPEINELLMLTVMSLYFILLVSKNVNVVAVVIILTMRMQKYVFLML